MKTCNKLFSLCSSFHHTFRFRYFSHYWRFGSTTRTFSIKSFSSEVSPAEPPKRKSKAVKSAPVLDYVTSKVFPNELSLIPKRALRVQAKPATTGYIVDRDVAQDIENILEQEDLDKTGTAVEISPGLGYLTTCLDHLGLEHLICFEEDLNLALRLQLKFTHVQVIKRRFLRLAQLAHADSLDGENRVPLLLAKVKETIEPSRLYIFGVTPGIDITKFSIQTLISNKVFYDEQVGFEHPVYYLVLGPRAYQIISAGPSDGFYNYRFASVLFQLLFKWKVLKTFPSQAFLPWQSTDVVGREQSNRGRSPLPQPHTSYFVKFETNFHLLDQLNKENLFSFYFFVRHNLFSRRCRVIPNLEKFVPDCGPRLIRKGFTIFTHFGELSPEQILELYLEFSSWPELEFSSFGTAAENLRSKFEIADENVIIDEKSNRKD